VRVRHASRADDARVTAARVHDVWLRLLVARKCWWHANKLGGTQAWRRCKISSGARDALISATALQRGQTFRTLVPGASLGINHDRKGGNLLPAPKPLNSGQERASGSKTYQQNSIIPPNFTFPM
jgi:hypothetical protein